MVQHRIVGVIPARFSSTRFPGKPLALIAGRPLILHVLDRVSQARKLSKMMVATDHPEIEECVRKAGFLVYQTPSALVSGTDRVRHALNQYIRETQENVTAIVNIQGDEPLVEPRLIDEVADALACEPQTELVTASYLLPHACLEDRNVVKVVSDQKGYALYFSRFPIPYSRNQPSNDSLVCRGHMGIYGFQRMSLEKFCDTPPSALEIAESLEQLRALDLGMKIKMIETTVGPALGVDTPEDVLKIEAKLKEKNEF